MRLLDLPPAIRLLLFSGHNVFGAPTTTPTRTLEARQDTPRLTTGPAFATSCSSAYWSYSSAYDSWSREHRTVSNQTQVLGGTTISEVTYYANATTLCDGHPRVGYSPAISLSTGQITVSNAAATTEVNPLTYFSAYPSPSPTCSTAPSDCDPLWSAYSSAYAANNASRTNSGTARITAPPQTPPCMDQSMAASWASVTESIYGCGLCTIYGQGVELVYFPTTASRDMCASAPPTTALTHYGPGAVLTAYAGTQFNRNASLAPDAATAVLGGNTFVSGTAYISIASVWAEDRCSATRGAPVANAILAMPSRAVLSLRYSQDHFQYFASTDTQTGYPVSYADFNKPVPYSAWAGQAMCEGPWDTWNCGVVYDNDYRPQLAIPPEIRQLNPAWEGCQMWYGGLYDPPVALQTQASAAGPTVPGGETVEAGATEARPSASMQAPTGTPTTLPEYSGGSGASWTGSGASWTGSGEQSTPTGSGGGVGGDTAGGWHHAFTAAGQTWQASACGSDQACVEGTALSSGGPPQTLSGGVLASYGSQGLVLVGTGAPGSAPQAQQQTATEGGIEGPSRPVAGGTALGQSSGGAAVAWTSTFAIDTPSASPGVRPGGTVDAAGALTTALASATPSDNGDVSSAGPVGQSDVSSTGPAVLPGGTGSASSPGRPQGSSAISAVGASTAAAGTLPTSGGSSVNSHMRLVGIIAALAAGSVVLGAS
ncbi:hypothetical protein LTR53_013330 [Teratosphaeriaceae sp. CCFEE 6253]|nr:hypothetical protein LTR53_013330 [Teratosphaeriaceae sp. CCFEE 6253]